MFEDHAELASIDLQIVDGEVETCESGNVSDVDVDRHGLGSVGARLRPESGYNVRPVPGNAEHADERDHRWKRGPGDRDLGRVWITVVFAVLTVVGVLVVAVVGISSGRGAVEDAERVEVAVGSAILIRDTVLALQDERGLAEMWLVDQSSDVRSAYVTAQAETQQAVETLRSGWDLHREVLDGVGPPRLTEVAESFGTLDGLRDATLRLREDSTVDAYTAVIDVLIAAVRRTESIAANSAASSGIRSLVRIIEAGEALGRQRDVVTNILHDGDDVSQDEVIRLLLLQQAARTNLSSIRTIGVQGVGIRMSEFLVSMNSGDVPAMLETLESDPDAVDPGEWYDAASARLESLRLVGTAVESDLASLSGDLRSTAEATAIARTIGLSALLIVSLLAGAAAVGLARERARALDEHGDLAKGLFEWFEPEKLLPVEGVGVVGRYDAASEFTRAGGDWYDVYRIPGGPVVLTVGDVAGHGAYATAQMAQARNLLRGITLAAAEQSPAAHMTVLDATLRGSGTMATIFHAVLDVGRGELTYVRAGHLPGMARHDGSVTMLDGGLGSPVGAESGHGYTDTSVRLGPPWRILLFTDGLIEAREADIEASLRAVAERVALTDDDPDQLADTLIDNRPSRLDDAALIVVSLDALGSPAS